jgi:hypothetical protein
LGKTVTDSWVLSLSSYDRMQAAVQESEAARKAALRAQQSKSLSAALEALESVPGTLEYRDGEWITVYPLDEWVAAGAPRIPRALTGQPPTGDLLAAADVSEKDPKGDLPAVGGDSEKDPGTGKLIPAKVSKGVVVESVLDVRTVGFCDKKWIISRKKTRNLGDMVNLWKKVVLNKADDGDVIIQHLDEWQ